jgi:phosphatidylserine/phosphatidylglycerophosphate/cardiolipin synthase-like enzyme
MSQAKYRSPDSHPASARILRLIALLVITLLACKSVSLAEMPPAASQATVPAAAPAGSPPDWVKVFFTDPDSAGTAANDSQNGIDQRVVQAIDLANQKVDVASFDFNLPSVTQALVRAAQRGVLVRVVVDRQNGNQELKASLSPTGKTYKTLTELRKAKIKIVDGGRSNGLMHDKIVLIDDQLVFIGSWNLSYNDTFRNNNNLLEISDPQIVQNYQAKFDEMFVARRFGAQAEVGAVHPSMDPGGTRVENYFSPPDGVMEKLVNLVQNAQSSVRFMAYTYTHPDLAQAMIDRAKAGVQVEGVFEARGATQGAMPSLFCAGLPVRLDGNPYTMHHKVIIIDEELVISGSFNFTKSADTANDDHVIVILDRPLAAQYLEEFDRIYSAGHAPDPAEVSCP